MTVERFVKKLLLVMPIVCFVLGLIFGAICYGVRQHELHFMQVAATADATVVALDAHDSGGTVMYAPVFTFTTTDGQPHTIKSKTSSNPADFQVGQHAVVIYDPSQPDGAEIKAFWHQWLVTVVVGVFSVAFLIAAVFFWLLAWALSRRHKPPTTASATAAR